MTIIGAEIILTINLCTFSFQDVDYSEITCYSSSTNFVVTASFVHIRGHIGSRIEKQYPLDQTASLFELPIQSFL